MGFPGELIKEESVLTGTKSSVEIEHNNKDCGKSNQRDGLSSDNLELFAYSERKALELFLRIKPPNVSFLILGFVKMVTKSSPSGGHQVHP